MKISQVLKETTVPQIIGDLIRFQRYEECAQGWLKLDEPIYQGKCALGVLACESGKDSLKLDIDKTIVNFGDILEAYGIVDNDNYSPLLLYDGHVDYDSKNIWHEFEYCHLSTIIIRLNDTYKLTFEQIGEFLEVTFGL